MDVTLLIMYARLNKSSGCMRGFFTLVCSHMNIINPMIPAKMVKIPILVVISENPISIPVKDRARTEVLLILNLSSAAPIHSPFSFKTAIMAAIPKGIEKRKILLQPRNSVKNPPKTGWQVRHMLCPHSKTKPFPCLL